MNYKFLSKNGVLLGFLLAVVCIVVMFIPILSGLEAYEALPDDVNIRAASEEGGIFGLSISIARLLAIVAFGLAIVLSIVNVFKNFKANRKAIIAFVALAVLFLILYSTASTDVPEGLKATVENPEYGVAGNPEIYKMITGSITGTLILLAAAFALMVLMEVWNFFKNS